MKKILFPARGLNRDRCIPLCTTFSGWALGTELRRLNGSRHSNVVVYLTQSGDRLRRSVKKPVGPRVELKQEPVSPLIVIKNPWVILLTSGLFFNITTGLHLIVQLVQW